MKKTPSILLSLVAVASSFAISAKSHSNSLTPGARSLMLAHNAYPNEGEYWDRFDRVSPGKR
jgi:hypothetical protein